MTTERKAEKVSDSQLQLARHALGLPNESARSYRNRFYVPKANPAHAEWCDMVAKGLAKQRSDCPGIALTDMFTLTKAGAEIALLLGERLDPEDFPTHLPTQGGLTR